MSIPLVNAHTHPVAAGPLFASHPVDLQIFPISPEHASDPFERLAHIGPPSCNVEAKLAGVNDEATENGSDPVGMIMIRGPSIGKIMGTGEESYIEVPSESEEHWVATGERAKVLANGAFKVLSRK